MTVRHVLVVEQVHPRPRQMQLLDRAQTDRLQTTHDHVTHPVSVTGRRRHRCRRVDAPMRIRHGPRSLPSRMTLPMGRWRTCQGHVYGFRARCSSAARVRWVHPHVPTGRAGHRGVPKRLPGPRLVSVGHLSRTQGAAQVAPFRVEIHTFPPIGQETVLSGRVLHRGDVRTCTDPVTPEAITDGARIAALRGIGVLDKVPSRSSIASPGWSATCWGCPSHSCH